MHLKRKSEYDIYSDGELELYSSKLRKKIKIISYEEKDIVYNDIITLKQDSSSLPFFKPDSELNFPNDALFSMKPSVYIEIEANNPP